MDLYADLPLAKGAASAALDADGKLKTTAGSSVWKAAPAFVPQVLRNAPPPPPVDTRPAPTATAAAPEESAKRAGVSLAFKPASVTRKSPKAPGIAAKTPVGGNSGGAALEDTEPKPRGLGFGFATVTSTTEVRIQHQPPVPAASVGGEDEENQQAAVNAAAGGFFHSSYRDEYNPARPNSYEAFCEERLNRKKLEQVKKELDRRQREQEIEGKRERERLVRDVEAGKAPAADLSAAGRGRGMTVPAWMRKKMEETAARQSEAPNPAQSVSESSVAGQFDDAAPHTGLGFAASRHDDASGLFVRAGLGSSTYREIGSADGAPRNSTDAATGHGSDARDGCQNPPSRDTDTRGLGGAHGSSDSRPQYGGAGGAFVAAGREASRGCVILLQNMVGPGEVDDELQDEVKEECAEQYGPVLKCVVYEVGARAPPEQAVRIFVQFERSGDAEKARQGLNARFFGGRKVQASYYDDDKFRRLDLTA